MDQSSIQRLDMNSNLKLTLERYLPKFNDHKLPVDILLICFEYLIEIQLLEYGGFLTYFNDILEGEFLEIRMSGPCTESGYYINNKRHGIVKQWSYNIMHRNLHYNNGDLVKITRTCNNKLEETAEHYKKGKQHGFYKTFIPGGFMYFFYDEDHITFSWVFNYWKK